MADFWIKIEKNTPDKIEVYEMAEILGISKDEVLGKLIRAWSWIDGNSSDGHIKSVTGALLDDITKCDGFADAMKSVKWLSENNIPNFDRHLGESAKKRAKDTERKRKSRVVSDTCPQESVTESGLDKIRVDKSRVDPKSKPPPTAVDFSIFGMTDEQVSELKRIRKKTKGGTITTRVAKALAKEFQIAMDAGFSIDDILTEWETRNWKSFKAEWIKPKSQLTGGNTNARQPKQSLTARTTTAAQAFLSNLEAGQDNDGFLGFDDPSLRIQVDE